MFFVSSSSDSDSSSSTVVPPSLPESSHNGFVLRLAEQQSPLHKIAYSPECHDVQPRTSSRRPTSRSHEVYDLDVHFPGRSARWQPSLAPLIALVNRER